MTRAEFEKMAVSGFEKIPEKFKTKIKNVAILIEDEPSQETRRIENLAKNETLLGLYQGIPHTVRGDIYGVGPTLPDTITLYQKPIEEEASETGAKIEDLIAEVIWHEFAHYFGMDEDEVRFKEKNRKRG